MNMTAKCCLALLLVSAAASAADDAPVARVNGQPIPQAALEVLIADQKARGAADTPELRKAVREELITRAAVLQEAQRLGLDKNPVVVTQVELATQTVILSAMTQAYGRSQQIPKEELESAYQNLKQRAGSTEYRTRHIFFTSEADAKAAIAELSRGEKFDSVVRKSQDTVTRERGGDLGWLTPISPTQPAIISAAAGLAKGKFSTTPVSAGGGFHVVLLEDTRPLTFPPFEQLAPQLTQRLIQERWNRFVADLRAKVKVD